MHPRPTYKCKHQLVMGALLVFGAKNASKMARECRQTTDISQAKGRFSLYCARTPRRYGNTGDTDRSFAAGHRTRENESTADSVPVEFASNEHRFTWLPGG